MHPISHAYKYVSLIYIADFLKLNNDIRQNVIESWLKQTHYQWSLH